MTKLGLAGGVEKVEIDFPTSWNELSRTEIEAFCSARNGRNAREHLLVEMIKGRAKAQKKKLPDAWLFRINPEEWSTEVAPLLDALLDACDLTRQPYPAFYSAYGPTDNFNDMTVGEYEVCEVYAGFYLETEDAAHLRSLAQALWRKRKNGVRIPFDEKNLISASFFKRLPESTLQAIYLWYTANRAALPQLFPEAFGMNSGGGDKTSGNDPAAVAALIHAAAGPKNGLRSQIRATLLKEFLFECQQAAKEQLRLENLYNQQSA